MRARVLFDANGSNIIQVVGLGHYVPLQALADLQLKIDAMEAASRKAEQWLANHDVYKVQQGGTENENETELQQAVRLLKGKWPAHHLWSSNRYIYLIHNPFSGGYATTDSANHPAYRYICTKAEFEQAAKQQITDELVKAGLDEGEGH